MAASRRFAYQWRTIRSPNATKPPRGGFGILNDFSVLKWLRGLATAITVLGWCADYCLRRPAKFRCNFRGLTSMAFLILLLQLFAPLHAK